MMNLVRINKKIYRLKTLKKMNKNKKLKPAKFLIIKHSIIVLMMKNKFLDSNKVMA